MGLSDAAIVGYAETKIVEKSDRDVWELGAEILETLLDNTGFEKGEIDGLILSSSMTGAGNPFWSQTTADQLALEVDHCQTVDIGGCSPLGAVARAAAAIDAGLCSTVLCLYADTQAAENNQRMRSFQTEWTAPLGYIGPPAAFGLLSRRYEHQFGLDYAALGKLAVAQRGHAVLNELAVEKLRKPISVDDYLNSRMIADPIRLLDSVMVCDGASGLLVTGRIAAETRGLSKIVVPIGYGERTNYRADEAIVDVTESGHYVAGQRAFAQSGLKPADIASFHPYDDFIIAIMLQLEMLGFCKRGQGCGFIDEHDFTHCGDFPLNTGGGQISAGQCGLAGGGTNLIEAVRQLLGEGGERQVKDTKNALVTGIGGIPYGRNWSSSVVMILTPNACAALMTALIASLTIPSEPPRPRSFSKAYWNATRDKRLIVQYDRRSGKYQFFPRATSIYDGRRDLEWREVSGKGEVFSYTIADRARPPFQGHEPFAIGLVTLDEGVNVMANIVHCGRDRLKIGLRVKQLWAPLANGTHLLMFEPD